MNRFKVVKNRKSKKKSMEKRRDRTVEEDGGKTMESIRGFARIPKQKEIFAVYSADTGMPFLYCVPGTFQDRIFLFEKREAAEAFQKRDVRFSRTRIVRLEQKEIPAFFSGLFLIGATELVYTDTFGTILCGPLDSLVRHPDWKENMVKNPELSTTALYYLQELRRPGDLETKRRVLADLEEELNSHLSHASFYSIVSKADRKKFWTCRNSRNAICYPLFLDWTEVKKFDPDGNGQVVRISFSGLLPVLKDGIEGFLVDPAGMRLPLTRRKIKSILES